MQKSVDTYIEFWLQQGRAPENPFSGKLMIHTSPGLHCRIVLEAARRNVNMDTYIQEILEKAVTGK